MAVNVEVNLSTPCRYGRRNCALPLPVVLHSAWRPFLLEQVNLTHSSLTYLVLVLFSVWFSVIPVMVV